MFAKHTCLAFLLFVAVYSTVECIPYSYRNIPFNLKKATDITVELVDKLTEEVEHPDMKEMEVLIGIDDLAATAKMGDHHWTLSLDDILGKFNAVTSHSPSFQKELQRLGSASESEAKGILANWRANKDLVDMFAAIGKQTITSEVSSPHRHYIDLNHHIMWRVAKMLNADVLKVAPKWVQEKVEELNKLLNLIDATDITVELLDKLAEKVDHPDMKKMEVLIGNKDFYESLDDLAVAAEKEGNYWVHTLEEFLMEFSAIASRSPLWFENKVLHASIGKDKSKAIMAHSKVKDEEASQDEMFVEIGKHEIARHADSIPKRHSLDLNPQKMWRVVKMLNADVLKVAPEWVKKEVEKLNKLNVKQWSKEN